MNTVPIALVALALSYAGMVALSLAMDRHHGQVLAGRALPGRLRIAWRVAGALLLACALWACMAAWGAGIGAVAWTGLLNAAALVLACLLSYLPRWVLRAAVGLAALAFFFPN